MPEHSAVPEARRLNLAMLWWLVLSAGVILLDQLSKALVVDHLRYADPHVVLPVFNLTLLYNTGAAFSFLA